MKVLLTIYAKCIDGRDQVWFDRIDGARSQRYCPVIAFSPGFFGLRGRALTWYREVAGTSPVAFAGLGFDAWAEPELFSDALGAHRGLAVHPARPHRPATTGCALACR